MNPGFPRTSLTALRMWGRRQILTAVGAAIVFGLFVGLVTVLIPNSLFARDIPPVWWNYPVWIVTSVLAGMLVATYVRPSGVDDETGGSDPPAEKRTGRLGLAGGFLAFFAVGCPVCNKIAVLALGYSGAITWFAPLQPVLAVGALVLTGVALVWRLKGQVRCVLPQREPEAVR